jgi:hypothetical protein
VFLICQELVFQRGALLCAIKNSVLPGVNGLYQ